MNISKLNIALAHDSLTQLAERRGLEALRNLSQVPVLFSAEQKLKDKYKTWDIHFLAANIYNIPKLQYILPVIPLAVSSLDFKGYDLVISTSSGFIKISQFKNRIYKLLPYPARFLWSEPNM